tara:strand:+ start:1112 stop:1945 length:834 start_codon:yes stop_codon:yes gene_type:complete
MSLAMLTWAMAWTNAHIVNQYISSFYNLVFLRFFLGLLSLLPIIIIKKDKLIFDFNIIKYVFPASILFLLYNISFFIATQSSDVGRGAVLVTTINPIITFIIMIVINKKIRKKEIIGISLGMIGGSIILDLFSKGILNIFSQNNIYFVFCAITWGIMTVITNFGQQKIKPLSFIFLCYLFTTLFSLFFVDFSSFGIKYWDLKFYFNFFLVSIGAMSFGTSVYMYSTSLIGPVKSSVFIFSVPFIAMGISSIFLNEVITTQTIFGGILSLLAIYIVNK